MANWLVVGWVVGWAYTYFLVPIRTTRISFSIAVFKGQTFNKITLIHIVCEYFHQAIFLLTFVYAI